MGVVSATGFLSPVLDVLLERFGLDPVGQFLFLFPVVGVFPWFAEFIPILSLARIPLLLTLLGILAIAVAVVALLGMSLLLLMLLRLEGTLLLGALVKRRGEFLERGDELGAEVTLGFVGFLDGFGHLLDGPREALDGGVKGFEAGGDAP